MTLPERLALAAWLAVNTPPAESQALSDEPMDVQDYVLETTKDVAG